MRFYRVPCFFPCRGITRSVSVVLVMLGALSASMVHAKTIPFAPADHVGPYKIGYNRVELVDPSRDIAFGGRTLVTHIWYPIDDAAAAGAVPVIYDSGLVSLALFGIPVSHIITRSLFGALVDASSKLPPSGDIPGACTAPPLPPNLADPCGTSVIVGLPISGHGPFPLLMFSQFYRPDNFAVWNAVTLPGTAIPLSALLFPPDLIPGFIDPDSLAYTPSLASSTQLQIVTTEAVAFFNKHLLGDMRYHHYLLPSYAKAKKLAAEVEYCKATPGNAEVCFAKPNTE